MTTPDEKWLTAIYEEKMEMMSQMSEADQARAAENVPHICKDYCGKCPSYQGTGETKLVFCALGKSSVIKEEKGCLCGQCPISKTMCLRWEYYCTRGKAMERSEAEKR